MPVHHDAITEQRKQRADKMIERRRRERSRGHALDNIFQIAEIMGKKTPSNRNRTNKGKNELKIRA
jgi:hypothetical protein